MNVVHDTPFGIRAAGRVRRVAEQGRRVAALGGSGGKLRLATKSMDMVDFTASARQRLRGDRAICGEFGSNLEIFATSRE